ncbi:hypothetical protein [Paenibacillus dendritiformis]|uniref:hypothetical protein n=1 Tax=Paenibacillus dendritiformis TaxID=130049 RepID=UPI001BCBFDB9|nr:hypothetical protein [Paenibacillus dendritiformis]
MKKGALAAPLIANSCCITAFYRQMGRIMENYCKITSIRCDKCHSSDYGVKIAAHLQDSLAPLTDPLRKLHNCSIFGGKHEQHATPNQDMEGSGHQQTPADASRHQ